MDGKVDGETKTFYVQLQFQFPDDPHLTDTHLRAETTYNGAVINPEAYQPKKGSKNTLYAIWVPDDCKDHMECKRRYRWRQQRSAV